MNYVKSNHIQKVIFIKEPLYINSNGILSRKDNTLLFINKEGKRKIPINAIEQINCLGKVSLKSGAIALLLKEKKIVNIFNKYGYYQGSLYPRLKLNSGKVVVQQALFYKDSIKRNEIAIEMVKGIKHNMLITLKYYQKKGKNLDQNINKINNIAVTGNTINQILSSEGRIWEEYYQSFNQITKNYKIEKRQYRPPTDEINTLISFGNALLYTTTLSQIYHTYLHPSISFLHEPRERRYSLACDLADIFKPIIVSRTIFKLVNNNMIKQKHFKEDIGLYLTENGRKIFIKEYQKKLKTTVKHPNLNKKVSYEYLIRLEGYKLIKHLLNDKIYESFKMWW